MKTYGDVVVCDRPWPGSGHVLGHGPGSGRVPGPGQCSGHVPGQCPGQYAGQVTGSVSGRLPGPEVTSGRLPGPDACVDLSQSEAGDPWRGKAQDPWCCPREGSETGLSGRMKLTSGWQTAAWPRQKDLRPKKDGKWIRR